MLRTSVRVLRLLTLLQARRDWSGRELGARLEVDVRTLRRDVDRLRDLGYAVASSSGVGGGYRLGAGTETPPLLLDDDEAVAVAAALTAHAASTPGQDELLVAVLAKLDQVLPRRVRDKLGAIEATTSALPTGGPSLDVRSLAAVAGACRDAVEIAFDYRDAQARASRRRVEPLRVVFARHRWYLLARDVDRDDFRTFRLDRLAAVAVGPRRFVPRLPEEGAVAYVERALAGRGYPCTARLVLSGAFADLRPRVPAWLGPLTPRSKRTCELVVGAETETALVALILHAGVPFRLLEPESLAPALVLAGDRLRRGAGVSGGGARRPPSRGGRGAPRPPSSGPTGSRARTRPSPR